MAKADWTITGLGGYAIVESGGSMRCQISASKLMLWNGRNDIANTEIVAEIKTGSDTNYRGGLVVRSDGTLSNCYRLLVYGGTRTYYIQKIVAGVATTLGSASSSQSYNIYLKTRFRVDGYQLSIEEYVDGSWRLVAMLDDTSQARANGSVGIFGENYSGSYSTWFDNVEIRERI